MSRRILRASAADELSLDPSLDFMRLLWSVEHGLQRASKHMEHSLGITGPQRLVLRIVGQFPDVSPKELARIVHLHPSTITGILQRLVGKGLLERKGDLVDRRRVKLRVPRAGKRFTRRSNSTVEAAVEEALSEMPRDYVQHAREVLWAIAAVLDGPRG